jgi:aldose 1-epimerase
MAPDTDKLLYSLRNPHGMEVAISALGGIIQRLTCADRNGDYADVLLGFESADRYRTDHPYFGALIGRYCNRIAAGRFSLGGSDYVLACNDGKNHLHGGQRGFDKVEWHVDHVSSKQAQSLVLSYTSADGEEGYPGELSVIVTYTLGSNDELKIDYQATTTRPTPVSLTSHPYFNLEGQGSSTILEHELEIMAAHFTPVDRNMIPTGVFQPVDGTPMDFRKPMLIGERIGAEFEQLQFAGGYDHNWVLNKKNGVLGLAARVAAPSTGRIMEVLTTEPGLQLYTGNSLDGIAGKSDVSYGPRSGFCLETQHFPDSPNKAGFPSTILRPGEICESTTIYRFSTIPTTT